MGAELNLRWGYGANSNASLIRPFDAGRERTIAGWLRIAFFCSILFNHAVTIPWEFIHERRWLVLFMSLRDFGAVGFFLLAGVSLEGKTRSIAKVKLPSNLLKLVLAAAALTCFDMLHVTLTHREIASIRQSFYSNFYDTNLWFFVAYTFAMPLLLTLGRKGVFWTGICCLGLIMFPGYLPLQSPYILQTISFAFVCMAIGMELYGRQMHVGSALTLAIVTYVTRVWLDDYGYAEYPAIDVVLRIMYGVACFMVLKSLSARLSVRFPAPKWTNYLFVPYVIQFPLIKIATIVGTFALAGSLSVRTPPIFVTFWETLAFMLFAFAFTAVSSFVLAHLLQRFGIRV